MDIDARLCFVGMEWTLEGVPSCPGGTSLQQESLVQDNGCSVCLWSSVGMMKSMLVTAPVRSLWPTSARVVAGSPSCEADMRAGGCRSKVLEQLRSHPQPHAAKMVRLARNTPLRGCTVHAELQRLRHSKDIDAYNGACVRVAFFQRDHVQPYWDLRDSLPQRSLVMNSATLTLNHKEIAVRYRGVQNWSHGYAVPTKLRDRREVRLVG